MVSFDLSSSTPHNDQHHHAAAASASAADNDDDMANHIPEKTFRVTPHPNKWLDVRGDDDEDDDVLRLLRSGHGDANAYHPRHPQQGRREPMLDSCITNVPSVRVTADEPFLPCSF